MRAPRPDIGLPAYSAVGTVISSSLFTLSFFSLFGGRVREREEEEGKREKKCEGGFPMSVELVVHGHFSDLILYLAVVVFLARAVWQVKRGEPVAHSPGVERDLCLPV